MTRPRYQFKAGMYKNNIYIIGGNTNSWEKTNIENWQWVFGGSYHDLTISEMKNYVSAELKAST